MAHHSQQCDICLASPSRKNRLRQRPVRAKLHTLTDAEPSWPDAIYGHFRRVGVRQVGYVPDAGHSRLIELCQADNSIADVVLTTEEEGVGLVAGAALAAERGAVDAIERRRQLHQYVFAVAQLRLRLRRLGHHARRVWRVQSVAGADGRDHRGRAEARRFSHLPHRRRRCRRRHRRRRLRHGVRRQSAGRYFAVATLDRPQAMDAMMLDRRDFVRQLLIDRGDLLVVSGLDSATYDTAAAGDHPLNFYLWGAMGGTAMIGLGLALAQPERRVAVLTGDGDMLMGLGSLATIGV